MFLAASTTGENGGKGKEPYIVGGVIAAILLIFQLLNNLPWVSKEGLESFRLRETEIERRVTLLESAHGKISERLSTLEAGKLDVERRLSRIEDKLDKLREDLIPSSGRWKPPTPRPQDWGGEGH